MVDDPLQLALDRFVQEGRLEEISLESNEDFVFKGDRNESNL